MYLDAHQYKMVMSLMLSIVSVLFLLSSSGIFSQLIIAPQKEVLYLDVGIAKYFCCKTSTFFGIKSEDLFLPKRNTLCVLLKMLQFRMQAKNTVVFYARLTNYKRSVVSQNAF